ncbi:hypothetical protein EOD39_0899 [Acipenser ruthenus]|uniref:Uncharacterized protein n=1 Tax=Acipenser ruthenus TaxID=7906 RepID=A0A444UK33_ACIRT|nr:hypothetical protein EOD39_0899 [Acipenser ruthenus]
MGGCDPREEQHQSVTHSMRGRAIGKQSQSTTHSERGQMGGERHCTEHCANDLRENVAVQQAMLGRSGPPPPIGPPSAGNAVSPATSDSTALGRSRDPHPTSCQQETSEG